MALTYVQTGDESLNGFPVYRLETPAGELDPDFGLCVGHGRAHFADLAKTSTLITDSIEGFTGKVAHVRLSNGFVEFIMLDVGVTEVGFVSSSAAEAVASLALVFAHSGFSSGFDKGFA